MARIELFKVFDETKMALTLIELAGDALYLTPDADFEHGNYNALGIALACKDLECAIQSLQKAKQFLTKE